jgi:hypothetical protein
MKESHRFAVWLKDWASNPDIALPHLQSDWEDTKNPFFVWSAINVCDLNQRELPDWVRAYLASCALRMVSEDAVQASDLRKILPEVLGFPRKKRGPGNLLRPEGDGVEYMVQAMVFAVEIEKGAKPSVALHTASESLGKKVADRIDDKTLLNKIKTFFGLKNATRTNADWKRDIRAWSAKTFEPLAKEFRETSP